eukprot:m.272685 g.272685  ORF g.272685 m.272685 type:complete len:613 (+) comp54801_c0_seq1:13-1851(+)
MSQAEGRLAALAGQLRAAPCAATTSRNVVSTPLETESFPMHRQEVLKWNGWGYNDCAFEMSDEGVVSFRGHRYELSGQELPLLREWMEAKCNLDMKNTTPSQGSLSKLPAAIVNEAFVAAIAGKHGGVSADPQDRLFRAHGHTCEEIFWLRHGTYKRIPDLVVWPESHEHCVAITEAACKFNVVLIPFGGGTTVTGAVLCPESETRMIVSLDTSKMNKILWIDKDNMLARVQAGVVGSALEKKLAEYGVCTGHEPDSQEFSTVGGWVATRASGMKKNVYGNIEDIVVSVRIVTPQGTVEKSCTVPRISAGPDIHHFILGSEGTLGVVTEVTMRIRHLPEVSVFGSIVFPTFSDGVAALHEIANARKAPTSIRLMDNDQFQFGRALKPAAASFVAAFLEKLKTLYVTKVKGFSPTNLCVATLLFEGTKADVEAQQAYIFAVAAKHHGISGGEDNGKRGYLLTFVIAYIRDLGFQYMYLAESFETSAPWNCVENLARNVKDRIVAECGKIGALGAPLVSCRVTQTYDTGACLYFYFGFSYEKLADPVAAFHHVERTARDEVLANGGSISHHHGVGKIRKRWITETIGETGVTMLRAVKDRIDPQNIFGNGNLYP